MATKQETKPTPVGGLAFFSSLVVLCLLGPYNLGFLIAHLSFGVLINWLYFLLALFAGFFLARFTIRGHPAVFIHELKHSILSNLVGNKAQSLSVRRSSGKFAYKYTPDTAPYNAFIALAPYILPLFALASFLIGLPFFYQTHWALVILVGLGYGMDLSLNLRDVSPYQSDLYLIRGGFRIGLLYLIAMNLTLLSILLAWVGDGRAGLIGLFTGLWSTAQLLIARPSQS